MELQDSLALAAELRARARIVRGPARDELLFLAAEYERLAKQADSDETAKPVNVVLPKG